MQPLGLPPRKWFSVSMDFIVQLPKTDSGYDAIMVVVCRLIKQAHFIPTTTTLDAPAAAKLYLDHVYKHHGLPRSIISDRDAKFT